MRVRRTAWKRGCSCLRRSSPTASRQPTSPQWQTASARVLPPFCQPPQSALKSHFQNWALQPCCVSLDTLFSRTVPLKQSACGEKPVLSTLRPHSTARTTTLSLTEALYDRKFVRKSKLNVALSALDHQHGCLKAASVTQSPFPFWPECFLITGGPQSLRLRRGGM
jgi:hypothetical protein